MPLLDEGFALHVIRTRETLVINENMDKRWKKYWHLHCQISGTSLQNRRLCAAHGQAIKSHGSSACKTLKRENAFSESDVRLLQTLANSMSVALENARLFDETQRLLKITEDRAAELAIINSVQQGLASKLDIAGHL